MKIPLYLSDKDIDTINISRARHDIIVHPGFELGLLLKKSNAEKISEILPIIRAERTQRKQIGWRISAEIDSLICELAEELHANKAEIVRAVIHLKGLELEQEASEAHDENSCYEANCAVCGSQIKPRTDGFSIAAICANNREGNTIPVKPLANAILRAKADAIMITRWNPSALGASELRHILKSYHFEILESQYRAEQSENGFMVPFKNRFKYPNEVYGNVPGIFCPVIFKDVMAGSKDVILIMIDSEEEEEARIADILKRFMRSVVITVRGKDIIASSDNVSVKVLDDPELPPEVIKAEIRYV